VISVVMCTFNGERFIGAQLESIGAQRRAPDELVVCDDGSSDGTLAAVETFARGAPFAVEVHRNASRLGVAANFSRALGLAKHDVIVLADQDDVWRPDRLSAIEAALGDGPAVAAFSDADVIDGDGRSSGRRQWQVDGFTSGERERFRRGRQFDVLLRHNVVCGATLAIRDTVRSAVLPVPDGARHDYWIALVTGAVGGLAMVDAPLIGYRVHGANQVGVPARWPWQRLAQRSARTYGDELAEFVALRSRLDAVGVATDVLEAVDAKVDHLRVRTSLPSGRLRRLPRCTSELVKGHYHRYGRGLAGFAFDAFLRP
jgi:glycosyltransferase involved in cell wall biosynthesis